MLKKVDAAKQGQSINHFVIFFPKTLVFQGYLAGEQSEIKSPNQEITRFKEQKIEYKSQIVGNDKVITKQ